MKIGFIGTGNMATSMIRGILDAGLCAPACVCGSCLHAESAARKSEDLGINVCTKNVEVASAVDVLFLTCKPYQYAGVCAEIASVLHEGQIIVSVAPGISLAELAEMLAARNIKLVRCMPNTPAQVGAGSTSYCAGANVSETDIKTVEKIFGAFGTCERISEAQMAAATAIGGSAPAFVYAFIESLADGGVAEGLPRAQAQRIAAQTVMGSAKMVLESGLHPGQLKDAVCSPAGTTIRGMEALERNAFRGTVISAVRETTEAARGD